MELPLTAHRAPRPVLMENELPDLILVLLDNQSVVLFENMESPEFLVVAINLIPGADKGIFESLAEEINFIHFHFIVEILDEDFIVEIDCIPVDLIMILADKFIDRIPAAIRFNGFRFQESGICHAAAGDHDISIRHQGLG